MLWKIRAPPAIPQPFKSDSYDEALLALCVKLSRRCGYANCAADSSSAKNSVDFSISLPRSVQLRWRARERPAPLFESVDDHLVGGRDARGDGNADCRPRGVACKWLAQALDSVTENLAHKRCCCKTARQPCWVATQTIAPSLRFCPPYPQERTSDGHRGMSTLSLGLGRTGRSTA